MRALTLDFETYYDAKYSLKKLTYSEYVSDARFQAHGLAIRWPEGYTPEFQMVWDIIQAEITAGSSDSDIGKVMKTVNRIKAGIVNLERIQSHRENLRKPSQKTWESHEFTKRLCARSSDSEIHSMALAIESLCENNEPSSVEALVKRLKAARTGLLWHANFNASPVH